jgi:hypothetical protein
VRSDTDYCCLDLGAAMAGEKLPLSNATAAVTFTLRRIYSAPSIRVCPI